MLVPACLRARHHQRTAFRREPLRRRFGVLPDHRRLARRTTPSVEEPGVFASRGRDPADLACLTECFPALACRVTGPTSARESNSPVRAMAACESVGFSCADALAFAGARRSMRVP